MKRTESEPQLHTAVYFRREKRGCTTRKGENTHTILKTFGTGAKLPNSYNLLKPHGELLGFMNNSEHKSETWHQQMRSLEKSNILHMGKQPWNQKLEHLNSLRPANSYVMSDIGP